MAFPQPIAATFTSRGLRQLKHNHSWFGASSFIQNCYLKSISGTRLSDLWWQMQADCTLCVEIAGISGCKSAQLLIKVASSKTECR